MQKLKKLQSLPISIFLAVKKFLNKIFGRFFEIRTYHLEMAFVAVVLSVLAIIADRGFIEWIGVVAVFLNFGFLSVADRLNEPKETHDERLNYYYMSKEMLWLIYFVLLGAYSAILGIFLFLLYRPWRSYYRKYSKFSYT